MNLFELTKGGREWNEDRCFVCEDFAFVLDGATSLIGNKYSNFDSDAEWFSQTWKNYLQDQLSNKSRSLSEIVKQGIEIIADQYRNLAKGEKIEDFPSSAVTMFRINNDEIEYFALGDCSMLVLTHYNKCIHIVPEGNGRIDDINKNLIHYQAKKLNIGFLEARKQFNDYIVKGRLLKNKKGGYYTLSDNVVCVDHAVCGSFPKHIVKKILLMSDGFSQVFDTFEIVSKENLCKKINTYNDAKKYFNKLEKQQNKDSLCNKHLRFKKQDDTTLVYYEF